MEATADRAAESNIHCAALPTGTSIVVQVHDGTAANPDAWLVSSWASVTIDGIVPSADNTQLHYRLLDVGADPSMLPASTDIPFDWS